MRDIISDSRTHPTPELSIWNPVFFSGHPPPPPPTQYIFMGSMFWCVKDFQLCPASRWISFCFISSMRCDVSHPSAWMKDWTLSFSKNSGDFYLYRVCIRNLEKGSTSSGSIRMHEGMSTFHVTHCQLRCLHLISLVWKHHRCTV